MNDVAVLGDAVVYFANAPREQKRRDDFIGVISQERFPEITTTRKSCIGDTGAPRLTLARYCPIG